MFSGSSAAADNRAVGTAYGSSLVVLVVDQYGNPVPGATVHFNGAGGGASINPNAVNAPPVRTDRLRSPSPRMRTRGPSRSSRSVAGGTTTASFSLDNIGTPSSISVVSGTSAEHDGRHRVRRFPGGGREGLGHQPLSGVTVTFTIDGRRDGDALAHERHHRCAWTDQRCRDGLEQIRQLRRPCDGRRRHGPCHLALTNTAGAAARIVASSGAPQSATVNTASRARSSRFVTDASTTRRGVGVTFAPRRRRLGHVHRGRRRTDAAGHASATPTANKIAGGSVRRRRDGRFCNGHASFASPTRPRRGLRRPR